MKRLLLLITFILSVLYTSGQTVYPIRTYTVLNPPLPYTLSGFASEPGRMQLNVVVDDVSLDQYAVKFRITIQGNGIKLYTKPDLRQEPFYLDGGLTETVTGLDLEPLFNPDNLVFEGYSRNEYKRNGRLPEGVYRVWVDILDYYRSFQVSQSIPGIAMIYLTRAPRLSFPMSGSEMDPRTEPNLRFSWMGTLPADPLADVAYRFRLWEIRPEGRNPYEVARAMQPIFTEETTDPNFIYDMGLPPLIDGMNYAWQVEAFDREGRARFQNDGTSEVYQFRYGRSCITPEPVITSVAHTEVALRWQGDLSAQLYRISYKGSQETEWQHLETASITHTLKQLDDNTGYEIKVQAICGDQEGDYGRIVRCKTNRIVDYTCGATGDQFDLSNREPLAALGRFDEFKAADFVIEVEEAEGANGLFSGKGLALVPYLGFAKFMVSFENVFINTDHRMVDGQIEFIYDEASGMVLGFGNGGSGDGEEAMDIVEEIEKVSDKVITTDGEVTDVTVSDNTVTITKKDGTTEIIKIEEGDKVAIVSTDGSGGAVHVVDQGSGRVYTTPKKKAGGKKGSGSVGTAATTGQYGCVVDFKAPTTMRFGYDPVGDGKSKPDAYFHRNKSGDLIPWKSIQSGSTDFMDVVIKGDCHPDSLRYLRESGLITPSTPQDKGSRLMLTGLADGEEDILTVAVAKTEHINDSTSREILTEAGALGLVAYDAIGEDVVLVPVNDAQCPKNPGIIKTELDKLFGPAVTSWQVEIQKPLEVEGISTDAFKTSGNGFAARYTKDMKEVIKTFKRERHKENKTRYLFFVNAPNADRAGYMPLAGDYGFIFNFGSNTNVIGHELAHGTFNLRHTFSDQAQHFLPEKSTKNLMDYANGTELWKYQWDLIHNPETVLFDAFDEQEGAAEGSNYYSTIKSRKICHSETLDQILLQGKDRFSFRLPDNLDGNTNQNLFSIPVEGGSEYDIYYFEHLDDKVYPPYRGSIAILKIDDKKFTSRFTGTVTDFNFKGYVHNSDAQKEYLGMDLVVNNTSSVQLPFVKKLSDNQYYYRVATLDDLGSDDSDDKYQLLSDCQCYEQENTLDEGSGYDFAVTPEELQTINDLVKDQSTDPNPIRNVYYVSSEEEAIEIKNGLIGDAEAIAIDKVNNVTYLLSADSIQTLNTTPDALALAFGLMKEQSIAGMKLMIEFNQLLLQNAQISRKYWDTEQSDYSGKYYKFFRILGYTTDQFAFYCGLYDGVLEVATDLTGILNIYVATENPGGLKQMFTSLFDLKAIKDVIVTAHTTDNSSELNHQIGVDVVYVATFAYAIKDLPNAVSKMASTVNKNLKFLTKKAAKAFHNLSETLKQTLRKTPEGFIVEVLEDQTILFRQNNQVIATRTPEGSLFSGDIRNLDQADAPRMDIEVEGDDFWDDLAEYGDGGDLDDAIENLTRHENWVEVLDIRDKILSRKNHVLEIEKITTARNGKKGFTGCHSKTALDDYVTKNPEATIEFRNKNLDASSGVYEAEPIIKMPNGDEYIKLNNKGKSTFFPDSWSQNKVLDEVEHAIKNNHGKLPEKPNGNEYYGFSSNGKVEIHFYLNKDGSIGSYFPIKK